jgi:hypothetical protein
MYVCIYKCSTESTSFAHTFVFVPFGVVLLYLVALPRYRRYLEINVLIDLIRVYPSAMSLANRETTPLRSSSAGSSWVQPALPVQARSIPCSAIENLCARVHPSPSFFFPLKENDDPLQHYSHLARGLSRVFNQLPFLAGRLRQDARGAFTIEIPVSPEAGTRFHYADLSKDFTFPSFKELQAAGFPYGDGKVDGLSRLRPDPFPEHGDGCPVIIPQLAHVRGGLILTCSYSHLIGDLLMLPAWCDNWAIQTREVASAAAEGRAESPVPVSCAEHVMDRTRLTPPNSGPLSLEDLTHMSKTIPDWLLVDPTNAVALENMRSIVPPAYVQPSQSTTEEESRAPTSGVWRFSLASLKALHGAVQEASTTGPRTSTIDVLTAYLWAHIFRAKYVPSSAAENGMHVPKHSEIVYAGDVRRRLDPPLPKDYLGAAVDLFRCSSVISKLVARSTEAQECANIAELATAIRASNANWSETDYMTLLSLSQRTPFSPGFVPRGPIDVLVTDHSRGASVIGADWGHGLDSTVAYREPYLGRDPPAGEVTIMPRCKNGDLEVMISAEKVVIDRLAQDVDLNRRSEVVFVLHDIVAEKKRKDVKARL